VIISAAQVSSPMPGEIQNGDAALIRTSATGDTLLAVVDGLGHGPEAAQASRKAIEVLTLMPFQQSVLDAMQEMHQELRGTRGAAATLCIVRAFKLEICAVGNVALMSTGCSVPLVLSPGVLGHQVSRFRVGACEVRPGARLALLSDGISTRFRLEEYKQLPPQQACAEIMSRYRRKEDDASVLIADVRASA
jgi:negative regulator of sigma-B (phosphoserine phosphatase)